MHSHILSIQDFDGRQDIEVILESAQEMMPWAEKKMFQATYPNTKAVLAFFEASTRTHKSFKQAVLNLGLRIDEFSGAEGTSLMKSESLADTARMLAGQGADIIVLRSMLEGGARWIAKVIQQYGSETRIINGGDGRNQHPTQTLLDLLTIKTTLGRLENLTIGMVGDLLNGRTTHSLIQALKMFDNIRVVLVAPKSTEMPDQYKQGIEIVEESDSLDSLAECDIVYVTRFQLERITDPVLRRQVQGKYIISQKVLSSWKKNVRIMHPLPSVEEIAPDIKQDERLIAFHQAYLGIPTRMALILRAIDQKFSPLPLTWPVEDLLIPSREIRIDGSVKPIRHFQPISKGTVIDHIPPGMAKEIIRVLRLKGCLEEDRTRQSVQYVHSRKYRGRKDVLLLHDLTIPDDTAALLMLIMPDITINELPGNNTKLKKKFLTPSYMTGAYPCPNENCITNHDPEADSSFQVTKKTKHNLVLTCEYCERNFEGSSIIHY